MLVRLNYVQKIIIKEAAHHFYEQSFYMICYRRQRQMLVKIIFKILDYIFFLKDSFIDYMHYCVCVCIHVLGFSEVRRVN